MVQQARLEAVASGLAPVSESWFAVNARAAAWHTLAALRPGHASRLNDALPWA
jgi:hypothetical protein